MSFFKFTVPADFKGTVRLDKYIAAVPDGMNRSRLKHGVSAILVEGKPVKLSYKIKAGEHIEITWKEDIPSDILPENIPLSILYEDTDVTVIDKKQGMVTHPAAGNWTGTLVNALLYHWDCKPVHQMASGSIPDILAARRPGIVHRLDKDTSGTIITAKNPEAEEWLQKQFRNHLVKKEYIAIVSGRPPSVTGEICTQLIRDPKNRKLYKAVTNTSEGKYARTLYHCISCYGTYSLIRLRLKTGRTHQIRVHMKYIGCPIVGDVLYNGKKDTLFSSATLMLHARLLKVRLPGSRKYVSFVAPVPVRFKKVIAVLHALFPKELLK